jgi:hypothetical protein
MYKPITCKFFLEKHVIEQDFKLSVFVLELPPALQTCATASVQKFGYVTPKSAENFYQRQNYRFCGK